MIESSIRQMTAARPQLTVPNRSHRYAMMATRLSTTAIIARCLVCPATCGSMWTAVIESSRTSTSLINLASFSANRPLASRLATMVGSAGLDRMAKAENFPSPAGASSMNRTGLMAWLASVSSGCTRMSPNRCSSSIFDTAGSSLSTTSRTPPSKSSRSLV